MRVLVVDDDRVTRELLRRTLTHAGHETGVACDGEEALRVILDSTPSVVVCDWEMPGLTGPELCRRVRAATLRGYVYIIMLTSRRRTDDVVEGLTAGADEFLTKPVEPSELLVRVRTGLRIVSLETRELALFALAKLAESRDNETGAHLERVREYSRILTDGLAATESFRDVVTAEFARNIYLTSPLHDIGKVGIPDAILLKPARLSDREFEIMKQHTTIGADTIDAVLRINPGVEFLQMSRDIALTHHEQWSGGGYPSGLRGEEIPLCGRIVALADVYDALTSKRVYKVSYPHETARTIIIQGSGEHFDPSIVEVFLAKEHEFEAVQNRLNDIPAAVAAQAAP